MIEADGLGKTYRGAAKPALERVSLRVEPGEIVGVIGPNGSGKTTLMGCLLGLLRPDQGSASLGGHPAGSLEARRLVGHLPERLGFDAWMRGADFVAHHHALAGWPARERRADVAAALGQVGLDPAAWGRPLRQYSRGMLQRVGLAQALVGAPRCLLLDEPTSGMDPEGAILARERVEAFAAAGGAVLVNSHQLDQLGRLCHRVLFLKDGRLASDENLRTAAGTAWSVAWLPAPGDAERVRTVLAGLDLAGAVLAEGSLRVAVPGPEAAAALVADLVAAGVRVHRSGPHQGDLERFFKEGGRAGS